MPPNQTPAARRRRLPRSLVITAAVAMILAACFSAHRPAPPLNTEGARISHLTIVSRYVKGTMPMTLVTPAGAVLTGRCSCSCTASSTTTIPSSPTRCSRRCTRSAPAPRTSPSPTATSPTGTTAPVAHGAPTYSTRSSQSAQHSACRPAPGGDRRDLDGRIGAYDLARHEPGRFCAVGGHSATIAPTYDAAQVTEGGSFDNASEFARHDLIAAAKANPKLYGHAQLWLDDGASDPLHDGRAARQRPAHPHAHLAWRPRLHILEQALGRLPRLLRTRNRNLPLGRH